MARIRYLKPEFFEDEHLAELPYWVRLLFAGMWNIADKAGRLEDRPKKIKIKVFPYDDKIDIENGLNLLAKKKQDSERPFIIRYSVNDEKYIQIISWDKHQKPHHTEKESEIPEAPIIKGTVNGKENGDGKCSQSKCEVKEPINNGEITVNKKIKHLDFVLLTKKEYLALQERFGSGLETRLLALNDYIGSKGKKYASHYHTILNWERMEKSKGSGTEVKYS